jgi:hypothetical protein
VSQRACQPDGFCHSDRRKESAGFCHSDRREESAFRRYHALPKMWKNEANCRQGDAYEAPNFQAAKRLSWQSGEALLIPVWKTRPQPRIKPVIARDTTYCVSLLTGPTGGSNFAIPSTKIPAHGNGFGIPVVRGSSWVRCPARGDSAPLTDR